MKSIKMTLLLIVLVTALGSLFCSCDDQLEIKKDYLFDLTTMPIQSKIMNNETVEMRCQLVREGYYNDAKFYIRYFQSEGTGVLKTDDGIALAPNDTYLLPKDKFNLYYTSNCTEQQTFDIYITDDFGKLIQKTFNFQNEKAPEPEVETPVNYNFTFTSLPVPSQLLKGDTIEIRSQLKRADERNDATYSIRYFQPSGNGKLLLGKDVILQPNELYALDDDEFRLYYVSDCEERQTVNAYIVDNRGQVVQSTFSFENIATVPEPEIDFSFVFETLPVPKYVSMNDVVEIRCTIKKADERNTSSYSIRYFQPDGKGELRMDNGTLFFPNDLYPLDRNTFRLYYTSRSVVQQTIDVYIEDEHGKVVQKTFSLQNESTDDDTTVDETLLEE